jgi:hypothetical protein
MFHHSHHRHHLVALRVETTYRSHHRRHHRIVDLTTLNPNGVTVMNPVTVSIGHTVNCVIIFLDQNGNPMQTTPTPDSPPSWSDAPSPSGATTFTVGPGGLTASDLAVASGSDTISLSLSVGGTAYSATLGVTVSPAAQVLTSVQIGATVV